MSLEGCALVISILAAALSLYTWFVTYKKNKYDIADAALTDLLKITIDKPRLRDPEHCKKAPNSTDPNVRLEYDAYATLVWNYLESLFHAYGKRLRKSPFYGALKDNAERHKTWLFEDDRFKDYDPDLLKFLSVAK